MSIYYPKIAAYIRLSKEDEKEGESESVSNQKELIKKYIEQNNLGKFEFFIDDGYSGGNFERPKFKELINEIYIKIRERFYRNKSLYVQIFS